MTNFVNDDVANAGLDVISTTANEEHICFGDPTSRAEVLTNSLGNVALAPADFTRSDGAVSGRRDTLAQKNIPAASASGLAAVMCVIDGTRLLRKSNLAATQSITLGNPVTVNANDHEIRDPT